MTVDVLLGLQWGDEGKGKVVDFLAPRYDVVARFQGGPNAGHTLMFDNQKYVLHTIPSGIFRDNLINLIGNGVVIDPIVFAKEIDNLKKAGVPYAERLRLARKAHLILPTHRYLDAATEAAKGKARIGSTLKGIGPTYMDKTGRNGLRVGDINAAGFEEKYHALKAKHLTLLQLYPEIDFNLEQEEARWMETLDVLRSIQLVDGEYYLNDLLTQGKRVLAEGAQGSMLDIDFGTYPFVTSSNTVTAGVCTGLGVAPSRIGEVIGITKAYCTRVGSGPFPTEQDNETGEFLRREGGEFGATTGRPRRCGWLDLPQLRYSVLLNGVTQLAVTKIDVLNNMEHIEAATHYRYDGIQTDRLPYDIDATAIEPLYRKFPGWRQPLSGITQYEDLPDTAAQYLEFMEQYLGVPITMASTGPERESLIVR
ncbi:MAG: adenylosuccinate synthase [Saprospiraceae bacterium]|nr:adenylosuccinate synthase [Saprospiraceae bacterium]